MLVLDIQCCTRLSISTLIFMHTYDLKGPALLIGVRQLVGIPIITHNIPMPTLIVYDAFVTFARDVMSPDPPVFLMQR